jgi:transcriptional regulator
MINKSSELNEIVEKNRNLVNFNESLNSELKLLIHENKELKIIYDEILNESNL